MRMDKLKLVGEEGVTAVIETPRGSPYKFKYDASERIFRLSSAMPAGTVFPFDFGFISSTLAEDGDPLDVLILMESPSFTGCVLEVRVIGVIEAEQGKAKRPKVRNDRLIAVAAISHAHRDTRDLKEIGKPIIDEIEQFFIDYNKQKGESFKVLRCRGSKQAKALIKKAHKRFRTRRPA